MSFLKKLFGIHRNPLIRTIDIKTRGTLDIPKSPPKFGAVETPLEIAFIDMSHVYNRPCCAFLNKYDDRFIHLRDTVSHVFYDPDEINDLPEKQRLACIMAIPLSFFSPSSGLSASDNHIGELRKKLGKARGMLYSTHAVLEDVGDNEDVLRDIDKTLQETIDNGSEWATNE